MLGHPTIRAGAAALLLLVLSLWCFPTMAQSSPPEIEKIKSKGELVVAMTSFDNLPFYGKTSQGLQGLDVEIAQALADLLDVKLVFKRDATSFAKVVEQVRDHEADVAISKLSITGPRLSMVRFSQPYVKLKQALIVNRLWLSQHAEGRENGDVIRNFNGSLAFIANSSYSTFAKKFFPRAEAKPVENWPLIVQGVIRGTYSAGYRDEFEIKRVLWDVPEASINTKTVTLTDSVDNIAVAVAYDSTTLLADVDYVISNYFSHIDVKKLITMYQNLKEAP